jgi:hypothetical protein
MSDWWDENNIRPEIKAMEQAHKAALLSVKDLQRDTTEAGMKEGLRDVEKHLKLAVVRVKKLRQNALGA